MSDHAVGLSPDFAERVLRLADRRLVERRRARWIAAGIGLCAAVLGPVSWMNFAVAPQTGAYPRTAVSAAPPKPLVSDQPPGNSADALSYLFPDAEPLARFAAEDTGSASSSGAASLFNDED